jgi:hypothetical protein
MRGKTVVAVLVAAGTSLLPAVLPASALASAKTVTITVVGISRSGAKVAISAQVTPQGGGNVPGTGPTYHLKPGRYFIGAVVPTPASSPNSPSQTVVERLVNVRKSGTIKLDARGGKLVSVWLNGKDLGAPTYSGACVEQGGGISFGPNFGPDPASVYVKPSRATGLSFNWAWNSDRSTGTQYDLTGQTRDSLPAHPVFRVRTAQLAKTVVQVRAGTVPGTRGTLSEWSTLSRTCTQSGLQQTVTIPAGFTVYRSPASWQTELDTSLGPQLTSLNILNTNETAGHSYTVALGAAARGPGKAVPFVQDKQLSFDPQWQFLDPIFESFTYNFTTTVALSSGGHVIARKQFAKQGQNFTAKVHTGRWYVLTTDARQAIGGANLTGLLSPRTTIAWRFKLAKGASGGVPVADTSLVPGGLDLKNRAAPGSRTSVRASFSQGSYLFAPRPAVPVRSFTAQASFNDGKTWHGVSVVKHKGFYTFVVHNPSSGFVTLRTTTVNTRGFSSVQTIYRAYRIR